MLKRLDLRSSHTIGDEGVVALVEGLMAAPSTRLTELGLPNVSMGDRGVAALADAVREGRFEGLQRIDLTGSTMTDHGAQLLAQAIQDSGAHGLPVLSDFLACSWSGTGVGVKALASALINHCHQLLRPNLRLTLEGNAEAQAMVTDMVRAVGREGQLKFRA